jgi:hypothetical protein
MKKLYPHFNTDLFEKRFVFAGGAPSEGAAKPPEEAPKGPKEGKPRPLDSVQARYKLYAEAEARAAAIEADDPETAKRIRADIEEAKDREKRYDESDATMIARGLERTLLRIARPQAEPVGEAAPSGAELDKIGAEYVAQLEGKPAEQSAEAAKISADLDAAAEAQIAQLEGEEAKPAAEGAPELAKAEQAADKIAGKLAGEPTELGVPVVAPTPDLGPAPGEVQEEKPAARAPVRVAAAPTAAPSEAVPGGSGKAAPVEGPRVEEAPKTAERRPAVPPDVQTAANNFASNPDKFPARIEGSDGNVYTFQLETSTSQGVTFRRPKITLEGKKGA